MINPLEQAENATRLLLLAMTPRVTPANNTEYGELLTRFSTDPDFKEITRAIARGMGVHIYTELIQHGLMLVPHEGGFFAPTLDSFRRGMRFRERVAYGLLHYVLAAFVFPSEEALNDDFEVLSARIRPADVARFAVESCESLKTNESSREVLSEEMIEAYSHLLSLREGDTGGTSQTSIASMVRTILDKYEREGLFNVFEENAEAVYRSRPQFRVQVRFIMQESERGLLALLQQLRAGENGAT
ncbi:MAG TPA: hypothetical protein VIS96_11495 [Terrimicrobiaceae bacterium]